MRLARRLHYLPASGSKKNQMEVRQAEKGTSVVGQGF
jgi:hypothetical protein